MRSFSILTLVILVSAITGATGVLASDADNPCAVVRAVLDRAAKAVMTAQSRNEELRLTSERDFFQHPADYKDADLSPSEKLFASIVILSQTDQNLKNRAEKISAALTLFMMKPGLCADLGTAASGFQAQADALKKKGAKKRDIAEAEANRDLVEFVRQLVDSDSLASQSSDEPTWTADPAPQH